MFELFIASDAAQRRIKDSLELDRPAPPRAKRVRRRPAAVRSLSAAALRGLAERLEPSASA